MSAVLVSLCLSVFMDEKVIISVWMHLFASFFKYGRPIEEDQEVGKNGQKKGKFLNQAWGLV